MVFSGSCGGLHVLQCEGGTILNSNISFNRAQSSRNNDANGGGICLQTSSDFVIEKSYIVSNVAANGGGGLAILHARKIDVSESSFLSNLANDGGSVFIQESISINISYVSFTDNVAIMNGGSISIDESPNIDIRDSLFLHSTSTLAHGSSIWYVVLFLCV